MLNTGIAIFAYNRDEHLKKVLDGLRENEIFHSVYIFQDKEKNSGDLMQCRAVRKVVSEIDWMAFAYIPSAEHKGCARSIEDGIRYVLERHEAVIVIEDDCVPRPNFLNYMDVCLEKYKEEEKVIGVGGFAWNLKLADDQRKEDVYASGRTSSYGWGTWKNRWEEYKRDFELLKRIYSDREASKRLGIWGDDLEGILYATLVCKVDTWDVFWALYAIEKDKVFILPYKSLIENIGFDGSGTHCTVDDKCDMEYFDIDRKDFRLIEKCETALDVELGFAPIFNGYGHCREYKNRDCKRAVVWGTGQCYKRKKKYILKEYDIQAFIDKRKIQYFEGKPVIDCGMLREFAYDVIIILFQDKEEAIRMKEKLISQYGIPENKIMIG